MKKISEILTVDRIKDITSVTKDKVLAEMSEMVADAPEVTSPDALLAVINTSRFWSIVCVGTPRVITLFSST